MRRRGFLLGLLLAPLGGAEAAGWSGGVTPVQFYGPPPGRGRRRRRRCRLVETRVPVVDRFGRVRGYRTVLQEVCR